MHGVSPEHLVSGLDVSNRSKVLLENHQLRFRHASQARTLHRRDQYSENATICKFTTYIRSSGLRSVFLGGGGSGGGARSSLGIAIFPWALRSLFVDMLLCGTNICVCCCFVDVVSCMCCTVTGDITLKSKLSSETWSRGMLKALVDKDRGVS
jgi:hypothetical protein